MDFEAFFNKALDDHRKADDALRAEEHKTVDPANTVATMIHKATLKKLDEELVAAVAIADVAVLVDSLREWNAHGEVVIKLPGVISKDGYGFEFRESW